MRVTRQSEESMGVQKAPIERSKDGRVGQDREKKIHQEGDDSVQRDKNSGDSFDRSSIVASKRVHNEKTRNLSDSSRTVDSLKKSNG